MFHISCVIRNLIVLVKEIQQSYKSVKLHNDCNENVLSICDVIHNLNNA